jgi:hypothetical protein
MTRPAPSRRKGAATSVDLGHEQGQVCPFVWKALIGLEPPQPMAFAITHPDELVRIVQLVRRVRTDAKLPTWLDDPAWLADPSQAAVADLIRRTWANPEG